MRRALKIGVPEVLQRVHSEESAWLEEELLKSVGKTPTPLTAADWEGIRARGLKRIAQATKRRAERR
jgi:hypothetical protein